MNSRASQLSAAGVGLLSLAIVGSGLSGRDLTGDEIAIFTGGPLQTLNAALNPGEHFTGHMPLSYWLRWVFLSLMGEGSVAAWRMHAALGFAGASALTVLAVGGLRWAGLAGLLVALSPIAVFHGMDSSNYAWTACLGAGALVALRDPVRHRWWLVGCLTLAAWNDLYGVWLGAGVLVACWMMHRDDWPALRKPLWVLAALTALPRPSLRSEPPCPQAAPQGARAPAPRIPGHQGGDFGLACRCRF